MQPLALTYRSRRGCIACRRSHVKCDEQRPVCNRCYCKDETCDYGIRLIWPDESLMKGVSHGRGGRQSSYSGAAISFSEHYQASPGSVGSLGTHFLNTSAADIEEHSEHRYFAPESTQKAVARRSSHEILQLGLLTQIPQYDEKLMSFYDRILCGAATVENSARGNPFRALLIPLALESNSVLNALQAISAKSIALHQPHYGKAALLYHTDALSGLICCDTNGRWVGHLTGLLHLLGRSKATAAMPPFITNYLWYHFVVARTVLNVEDMEKAIKSYVLQGRIPTSQIIKPSREEFFPDCSLSAADIRSFLSTEDASETTKALLQWMGSINLYEINTYPGLSSGLLLLMNQITDLEYLSNANQIAEHIRKTNDIKRMLESHRQYASNDLQPATIEQVCASAETYRLGCLLYLNQKTTSIRARIVVRVQPLTPLFSQKQSSDLACQIVALLEDKPSLPKTMANPLWPLFMAGCSTDDDDLRVRILSLFSQVESHQRFCNVSHVRTMLEKIWRRRDLRSDEPIRVLRKHKKMPVVEKAAESDEEIFCDWDRVLQLMANFRWSLT